MIKGWYARHKDTGEWHKIEDIQDTGIKAEEKGGGNNYHLEGLGPIHQSEISDMAPEPMKKNETLEKGKCVRCGSPSKNGGSGGRCSACLKKLKTARHTPGTYQRNHQQADSALRRQDGKNGTASHKSSGRGSRKEIVGKMKRAEKKTGQKLSADRTNNAKGYASKNVRAIPEKLNRGRHKADPKKLAAWRKRLKKNDDEIFAAMEELDKGIGKKIAGAAMAGSIALGSMGAGASDAQADTTHLKSYLNHIHGMELDGHKVSVDHKGHDGEKGSGVGKFTISIGDYAMTGSYARAGDNHNQIKLSPMTHKKGGHKPYEDEGYGFVNEKGTAAADSLQYHLGQDGGDTSLWSKLIKPTKKTYDNIAELHERLEKAGVDFDDFLTLLKAKMLFKSDDFLDILFPE